MSIEYQAVNDPRTGRLAAYLRLADAAYVTPPELAPDNRDSMALAAYIAAGGEILPAVQMPSVMTLDARLGVAVDQAKQAVSAAGFTARQTAALHEVVDRLSYAIVGGDV